MLLPVIGKLFQLAGLLLLVGVPLFWWWLWRPALLEAVRRAGLHPSTADTSGAPKAEDARWLWLLALAGALLTLAGSGVDLFRILSPLTGGLPFEQQVDFTLSFLRQTTAGRAMLVRLPALAAVLVASHLVRPLWSRPLSPGRTRFEPFRWVWVPAVGVLLVTIPLTGHAVTSPTPLLSIMADGLHLAAALLWGGSLVGLSLFPRRGDWDNGSADGGHDLGGEHDLDMAIYAAAFRRMAVLGLAAVMTLVGSGILLAGLYVFGVEAVSPSLYGRSLALKLSLVAVLGAIAAVNRFLWLPRLERLAQAATVGTPPPTGEVSRAEEGIASGNLTHPRGAAQARRAARAVVSGLTKAVRAEAIVLLVVFSLTAVMTQTAPPANPGRLRGSHTWTVQAGPWNLQARLEPQEGHWVVLRVEVTDRETAAPAQLDRVVVSLDMPGHTMALAPRAAVRAGEGIYEVAAPVVMAGPWEARLHLVKDAAEAQAVLPFDVQEAPLNVRSPLQLILMGGWMGILQLVAAMATAAAGLWLMASWLPLRHRPGASSGALSGALFFAGGLLWIVHMAGVPTAYWPNPSEELALSGRLAQEARPLYEQHCAACHGLTGRGDGPQSAGLRTRPADFAVHVTHHTEGEFFWMITHGLPGTDMPPFGSVLTEEERWMLARYVQELGRSAVRQSR